jgi:hypothetical protein
MPRLHRFIFAVIVFLPTLISYASAQVPHASPTPEDGERVPTEEVHLTISAEGPLKGFTPKLRSEDFTVYEDGVAQTVTSMSLIPAHVMVLIDSGAALTFAKNREMTNLAAMLVVDNLPEGTTCSVAQYSEHVSPIVPWTEDRDRAVTQLIGAIRTGRRSMLGEALKYALESFKSQPVGNRHLILVTDGIDGPAAINIGNAAFRDLAPANIAVHILSLTKMEQEGAKDAVKRVRINLDPHPSKPRVQKEIYDDMLNSLPIKAEMREFMRTANESQQIVIVDLDFERRKILRTRRGEWEKGEGNLQTIAVETGGSIRTPVDTTALLNSAIDVARSIGSNYDVTYTPSRTISDASDKAPRNVLIASRSDAIKLKTRKTLSVPK